MATTKKKFDVESSGLFGDMTREEINKAVTKTVGRPRREDLVRDNTSQKGLPEDQIRATFLVNVDVLDTLKDYAYTERLILKDVVGEAFEEYIEKHVDRKKLLKRPENRR